MATAFIRKQKSLQFFGLVSTVLGIGFLVWGSVLIKTEEVVDPADHSGLAVFTTLAGLIGSVVGLSILLVGLVHRLIRLNVQARREALTTCANTIRDVNHSVAAARRSYAPVIFLFYGLTGMVWGFLTDDLPQFTWSDVPFVLALNLASGLILAVGIVHCRRRGSFLGLTLPWFVSFAALGYVSPILLFMFTN
jgi:hypothetical protein